MPRFKVDLYRIVTYSERTEVIVEADSQLSAENLALALEEEGQVGDWYANDDDEAAGVEVLNSEEIKEGDDA